MGHNISKWGGFLKNIPLLEDLTHKNDLEKMILKRVSSNEQEAVSKIRLVITIIKGMKSGEYNEVLKIIINYHEKIFTCMVIRLKEVR